MFTLCTDHASQANLMQFNQLDGNQIRHVGNHMFQNLKKLTKLSLSNNKIYRVDGGAFKGLSRLKELMIDSNELMEIPAGLLDPLERIEHLDLSDNQISSVDAAAFGHLILDLNGNNWTCDCRMGKLKSWMTALLPGGNHSGFCGADYQTEPLESRGAGLLETLVTKEEKPRTGEDHKAVTVVDAEDKPPLQRRRKWSRPRLHAPPSNSGHSGKTSPLLDLVGALTTKAPPTLREKGVGDSVASPRTGTLGRIESSGQVKHQEVRSELDSCQFNRNHIMNVSVDSITHGEARVRWSIVSDPKAAAGRTLLFRVLFDRFGRPVRFPRYVYTDGETRAVTLQELRPDSTYIACVESVVGGVLCQVAPRDHCAGFVTTVPSPVGGVKLQHVTVVALVANAVLLLLVGGVWLGRLLRKRLQSRKSAGHVHVRHMYSTRRPFRSTMATTCVSSEFSGYQSGRPLAEEGDLIQFPGDRFFEGCLTRRDNDLQLLKYFICTD
ncbi:hypothetical protein P4O66_003627 [Electrophorus voltai]|uniref:Fibronectin type-III domain-containing protein n=1 Tax=Electrophorus voltai TaxID=2609070 RepID=A0AAD8ZSS1_9TELE|nr:hypothetical protein P4O66_003627 [Electrophorus voltai]